MRVRVSGLVEAEANAEAEAASGRGREIGCEDGVPAVLIGEGR